MISTEADDMRREMQSAAQRQREELIRQRQQEPKIPSDLAKYLLDLETRIRTSELAAEEDR